MIVNPLTSPCASSAPPNRSGAAWRWTAPLRRRFARSALRTMGWSVGSPSLSPMPTSRWALASVAIRRDKVAGFLPCASRWRRYKTRSSGWAGKGARRSSPHQLTKQSRSAAIAALVASAIASSAIFDAKLADRREVGRQCGGDRAQQAGVDRLGRAARAPLRERARVELVDDDLAGVAVCHALYPSFGRAAANPNGVPSVRLLLP